MGELLKMIMPLRTLQEVFEFLRKKVKNIMSLVQKSMRYFLKQQQELFQMQGNTPPGEEPKEKPEEEKKPKEKKPRGKKRVTVVKQNT